MKKCLNAVDRTDGKARFELFDHGNGLYSFEETQEFLDEVPEIGPYTYWGTTYASGLYNDQTEAMREARALIQWLSVIETSEGFMEIRPVKIDDADGMSRVLKEIIDATGRQRDYDRDHVIERYISDPNRIECHVAVADGEILGFQSLKHATEDNPYGVAVGWGIIGTHVSPRAARKGVGSALFEATRQAAEAAKITDIDATIGADNDMGLAYYEAMGFRTYRTSGDRICKQYSLEN
ncbi:GNAT family N-acetyltransferase [Brucella pseudogrignonensis]